jgi:hypothetical protein
MLCVWRRPPLQDVPSPPFAHPDGLSDLPSTQLSQLQQREPPPPVVGATRRDSSGRAYVFTKTTTGWKQSAELAGSDTASGDYFGHSVAISSTTVVVGAYRHAMLAGRTYVFTKTASSWRQLTELKGSDTIVGAQFGRSVAISGTTAVIGGFARSKPIGRVYVFRV